MKAENFVKLGLDNESAKKATEAVSGMLKGFVPKHRFDEVNIAKKSLEQCIVTRDKQLEELKNVISNIDDLKGTISKLQNDNTAILEKYKVELRNLKREMIDNDLLTKANAKNVKAAAALLDPIDDNVDDELYKMLRSEAIKNLQRSKDSCFLFGMERGSLFFKGIKLVQN